MGIPKRPTPDVRRAQTEPPITEEGGCGQLLRAEELKVHLEMCPCRVIEIHKSRRQLRSWMSGGWSLVACDQTGENALTFAASSTM